MDSPGAAGKPEWNDGRDGEVFYIFHRVKLHRQQMFSCVTNYMKLIKVRGKNDDIFILSVDVAGALLLYEYKKLRCGKDKL